MFLTKSTKKAALDLSVGFLVKLILAIVVFGMGMVIVRNIFSMAGSGDMTRSVDDEVERQIKVLMHSGERIIVFPEEIETRPNRAAIFGLGILNVLDKPGEIEFNIEVECHEFVNRRSGTRTSCSDLGYDVESWTFQTFQPVFLRRVNKENEAVVSIPVVPSVNTQGTYVYNVRVTYVDDDEDVEYGITKFRVVVR